MLDFEGARREQLGVTARSASGGRHRVQVCPAMPLRPQLAEHAAIALRRLPHFLSGGCPGGIRDPNGPWRPAAHRGEVLVLIDGGYAQECDASTIRRPYRRIVLIHTGVQVVDGL